MVLAGGIAHDFNNVLVGIPGNAEQACGYQLAPRSFTMSVRTATGAVRLTPRRVGFVERLRI